MSSVPQTPCQDLSDQPAAAPAAASAAPPSDGSTSPTAGPPTPTGRRWTGYLPLAALLAGVALLVPGLVGLWHRATGPSIPQPALQGVEPAIAEAIQSARGAVVRQPGSAAAWGMLGMVLRAHEFDAESNVCFRRAAELDRTEPRWMYLLARGLRGADPDAAIEWLRQAQAGRGHVAPPRLMLGEMLLDRDRLDEAEPCFRNVLQADPRDARAWQGLGRVELSRQRPDAALEHLQRSASLAPHVKATRSLIVQALIRLDRRPEAEAELKHLATLNDEALWPDQYQDEVLRVWVGLKARLTLATELWKQSRRAETVAVLRQLVRDYPESAKGQYLLGDKLNQTGEPKEAEAPLRAAIRLEPAFSRAHFELAYSLHHQGRIDEAVPHYEEAIRLQPDLAVAHYDLSFCREARSDVRGAINDLRNAVRYNPNVPKAHYHLGRLLLQMGEHAEARLAIQRALALDAGHAESKRLLAQVDEASPEPVPLQEPLPAAP